jgi:hypothetical protein
MNQLSPLATATHLPVLIAVAGDLGRVDGFNQHQPARKTDDG